MVQRCANRLGSPKRCCCNPRNTLTLPASHFFSFGSISRHSSSSCSLGVSGQNILGFWKARATSWTHSNSLGLYQVDLLPAKPSSLGGMQDCSLGPCSALATRPGISGHVLGIRLEQNTCTKHQSQAASGSDLPSACGLGQNLCRTMSHVSFHDRFARAEEWPALQHGHNDIIMLSNPDKG